MLRLMLRRVGYALSLRFLFSLALGLLLTGLLSGRLSASRLLLSTLLSSSRLLLSTRLFSLLLLSLTRLTLSFLIASGRFGALPIHFPFGIRCLFAIAFLFAAVVYLRCLALVFNLELLISGVAGNTFHAHRLCQVPPERRFADIAADKNRRVPEFLRDARR